MKYLVYHKVCALLNLSLLTQAQSAKWPVASDHPPESSHGWLALCTAAPMSICLPLLHAEPFSSPLYPSRTTLRVPPHLPLPSYWPLAFLLINLKTIGDKNLKHLDKHITDSIKASEPISNKPLFSTGFTIGFSLNFSLIHLQSMYLNTRDLFQLVWYMVE